MENRNVENSKTVVITNYDVRECTYMNQMMGHQGIPSPSVLEFRSLIPDPVNETEGSASDTEMAYNKENHQNEIRPITHHHPLCSQQ